MVFEDVIASKEEQLDKIDYMLAPKMATHMDKWFENLRFSYLGDDKIEIYFDPKVAVADTSALVLNELNNDMSSAWFPDFLRTAAKDFQAEFTELYNSSVKELSKKISSSQLIPNYFALRNNILSEISEQLKTAETGPRGGNIIGKTKSGKPIYDEANHPGHKDFSKDDHEEAVQAHRKGHSDAMMSVFRNQDPEGTHAAKAQNILAQAKIHSEAAHGKTATTGPRGGNIIGKTKSGKPIYETADHPEHKGFTPVDHMNAMSAHSRAIYDLRDKHDMNAPEKRGVRLTGDDGMKETQHSVQWNKHNEASGHAGSKAKALGHEWAGLMEKHKGKEKKLPDYPKDKARMTEIATQLDKMHGND